MSLLTSELTLASPGLLQGSHLLVVDDDPGIANLISTVLDREGVRATFASSAEQAQEMLASPGCKDVAAILLDVNLSGRKTGWDLLEELRRSGDETPVLFISAFHTLEERCRGFELGADDYIAKPFHMSEMIARITAVLRRSRSLPILERGPLRLDLIRRTVTLDGGEVLLSQREFELLRVLMSSEEEVLSRQDILSEIWGLNSPVTTNVVEVQIGRLRKKIGASRIQTVVGQGYRLQA